MSLCVNWSDRLEDLAERLFRQWETMELADPLGRVCIVVGDRTTSDWLRHYFLFRRECGRRRILANVDFRPLAEFVNDWLAAQTRGTAEGRRPADHPYAKGVLAWRIDAILRDCADDPDLRVLASYVRGKDGRVATRRRFELAVRLAELFDDYLNGRFRMLVNWERGLLPEGADRWQGVLYRKLVEEVPETYTRDYEAALAPNADPTRAFAAGFPRYEAVHVFDVATAPWPYLQMLARLADSLPVTFWNFNPSRVYWLDDPTKREAQRELARRIWAALLRGENPPEEPVECMFETPDQRLLGALASGARGVLSAQLDMDANGCDWVGDAAADDFATLRATAPEVHVCHSPRRELEAARDALHRFFREHPTARPGDAQILCADWASYAPLAAVVFGESGKCALPIFADAGAEVETPISHSLGELLAFRDNRFEANAVFSLLGVPEIRNRFEIGADGLATLRDMIRKCNVHWGYDDADVRDVLGADAAAESCPFTWRHGLDRLTLDALLGPRADARELVDAGRLGRLQPCGNVEEERARLVGRLNALVVALADLRAFLKRDHLPEAWGARLTQAIDDFYLADDETAPELAALRRAVDSVVRDAMNASALSGREPTPVSGEIVCRAVAAAVKVAARHVPSPGDAVRIAPLNIGTAVPAQFVWICGLNDGTFPRCDYRPSFDLIGRHPCFFDVTVRERDSLALLKAALGARTKLAFSYVGRNVRTNEAQPAAVPLVDMLDWFGSSGVDVKTYAHPLQSFSPRYFLAAESPERELPPSFSAIDHDAAAALVARAAVPPADVQAFIRPFALAATGDTVIDVEQLVSFYSRPNRFLARERLGLRLSNAKYDLLEDDDAIVADDLSRDLVRELTVRGSSAVDPAVEAERLREEGCSTTTEELATAIRDLVADTAQNRARMLTYQGSGPVEHNCVGLSIAEAYVAWADTGADESYHVRLTVDGAAVVVNGIRHEVLLPVASGERLAHTFVFANADSRGKIFESEYVGAWIRHVAGHAAGGQFITVLFCSKDAPAKTYQPFASQEEAQSELAKIVHQATQRMSFDRDGTGGGDELPEEFAEVVGAYKVHIVPTGRKNAKGGRG